MRIPREPAYPKLEDAIRRNKVQKREIARILNITECGLSLKLRGKSDFKWKEVRAIKKYLEAVGGSKYEYEDLFSNKHY